MSKKFYIKRNLSYTMEREDEDGIILSIGYFQTTCGVFKIIMN
ncbi:MAG: hypothetical protein P8X73_01670 [Ignavibacteriaceae bacterium]|jgi:hypothetical protein